MYCVTASTKQDRFSSWLSKIEPLSWIHMFSDFASFSLYAELKMADKQAWISKVKSEFEKSPLVSNSFFGFILFCLEKSVEVEFACPCLPTCNAMFALAFFIVPAFLVVLLMINIQGCKSKENVFFSMLPAIVWFILLFLDGRYFACAKTTWSGRFVILDKAAPQKWCEPTDHNKTQERMIETQRMFSLSQVRNNLGF